MSEGDPFAPLGPVGRPGIEAVLFLADEPVSASTLADLLDADVSAVEQALEALQADYKGRGIEIRASAGGWRMYSSPVAREVIERWALAGRTGRLTQAALETLAVIAYKQPISRQEIGDIRGVNADGAVRSLVARGLVTESGRDHGPGQAILYATTPQLLERLGIDALDELPPLTDFLPESQAPDEPELGAINEIRRRLAQAGRDSAMNDDAMPPPQPPKPRRVEDMEELTDRLESAARSAMDRLRSAASDADTATPPGLNPTTSGEDIQPTDESTDDSDE